MGDTNVGKTTFINRWIDPHFQMERKPTIGVDFYSKVINTATARVNANVWDTAGQEKYKAITSR